MRPHKTRLLHWPQDIWEFIRMCCYGVVCYVFVIILLGWVANICARYESDPESVRLYHFSSLFSYEAPYFGLGATLIFLSYPALFFTVAILMIHEPAYSENPEPYLITLFVSTIPLLLGILFSLNHLYLAIDGKLVYTSIETEQLNAGIIYAIGALTSAALFALQVYYYLTGFPSFITRRKWSRPQHIAH